MDRKFSRPAENFLPRWRDTAIVKPRRKAPDNNCWSRLQLDHLHPLTKVNPLDLLKEKITCRSLLMGPGLIATHRHPGPVLQPNQSLTHNRTSGGEEEE
jgi:hypothetical protein